MRELRDAIVALYRKAATSLPPDIEKALRRSMKREGKGSSAREALSVILENVSLARKTGSPLCQDTGVPVFFVKIPRGQTHHKIREAIISATRAATKTIPLRPNAVDILTGKNSGKNTGINFPVLYCGETGGEKLVIDLILKGAGSENIGQIYKLPDTELMAERDLEGVRKCVLDAVVRAQGKGCPPYIVGVGIGASKDQVTVSAKSQFLRRLDDTGESIVLSRMEKRILHDINRLGIGPMGLGGETTALGVKIGVNHRHPASYFVDVSFMCWAERRARLIFSIRNSQFRIYH
ncbi:MAG: fumarate hydratase [Nitrospirota bacterium]